MTTKRHILDELAEREQVTQIADIQARRPVTPERRVRESSRAKCAQLNQMLAAQRAWEPHERVAAGIEAREPGRFAWSLEAQERMAHWLAQWGPVVLVMAAAVLVGWLLLG